MPLCWHGKFDRRRYRLIPLFRKTVLLAKVESTYGSDPTHAGTDAVLCHDLSITYNNDGIYRRAVMNNSMTPTREAVLGLRSATVTFWTWAAGAASDYGASAEVPRYDALLRACRFSATGAGTPATWTYAPKSISDGTAAGAGAAAGPESVALEVERDGVQHTVLGCVGNAVFTLRPGEPMRIDWTFRGLYAVPADDTNTTPDYSEDVAPPLCVSTTASPWSTIAAAGVFEQTVECVIDLRNDIVQRRSLNNNAQGADGVAGFYIAGRGTEDDPGISMVLTCEQKDDDFWGFWNARTSHRDTAAADLDFVLGSAAGNTHTLSIKDFDVSEVQEVDLDGIIGVVMTGRLLGTAVDNELEIVTT